MQYTFPSRLRAGRYNITVHTDYRNLVFEYLSNNNNIKHQPVTIRQLFPDLTVQGNVATSVRTDQLSSYIEVNFTVHNKGPGRTIGAPWLDRVYLSSTSSFGGYSSVFMGGYVRRQELQPAHSYDVRMASLKIPRTIYGKKYVHVVADYYNGIVERDSSNNVAVSGELDIPRVIPDLAIESFNTANDVSEVMSGSSVRVIWNVKNKGSGSLKNYRWFDAIFISSSREISRNSVKLLDLLIQEDLQVQDSYTQTAAVRLPTVSSGTFFLVLQVNTYGTAPEINPSSNNKASVRLLLSLPPSPDLQIMGVSYRYDNSRRLLFASWMVENKRNSMVSHLEWVDKLLLSPSKVMTSGLGVYVLAERQIKAMLWASQQYSLAGTFSVPKNVKGTFYLIVVTDAGNSITENLGERNNIDYARQPVVIEPLPLPELTVNILSKIPSPLTYGQSFTFKFEVKNKGWNDDNRSFWTDAIYAYSQQGIS